MIVKWGWNDGYVSNGRDQTVEIPDEDLEGMSEHEQEQFIDEYVRTEFENRVTYWWRKDEEDEDA